MSVLFVWLPWWVRALMKIRQSERRDEKQHRALLPNLEPGTDQSHRRTGPPTSPENLALNA